MSICGSPDWGLLSRLASTHAGGWIGPMALFGSVETLRSQAPQTPAFAAAWSYIEQLLRPGSAVNQRLTLLAAGASEKHDLGGGVFAIEQAYETKVRSDAFFESHRKYVDVQVVAEGEELMEVVDIARAALREAYQDQRDLVVYNDATGASQLRLSAGEAAVFFPPDVHMPSLRSGANAVLVRKSVVKIPVSG